MRVLFAGMHINLHAREYHSHDSWEIIYCTEGRGRFHSKNGPPLDYGANDVIIVSPQLIHSNISDSTFSNYYFHFDNTDICYDKVTKLHDDSNNFLLHTLKNIYMAFQTSFSNKQELLYHLGAAASSCIKSLNVSLQYSPIIKEIKSELENKLTDPTLNINEVLLKYHPSVEYLRKLFQKETDYTPLRYLTNIRLAYAQKLLKIKDDLKLNITEISAMSGFTDPLYFSRLYKKHFGSSPKGTNI